MDGRPNNIGVPGRGARRAAPVVHRFPRIQEEPLGRGTFGVAYLCRDPSTGKRVCVKEIELEGLSDSDQTDTMKEVKILEQLEHPCILSLMAPPYKERNRLCIVTNVCEGGELLDFVVKQRGRPLPEKTIKKWIVQMVLALLYVHKKKILHRDLKLQNLFLTRDGDICVGDFGIARVLAHTLEQARTITGTPYYLSPEVCSNRPYNHKSDMWAVGCIIYELCAQRHAFEGSGFASLSRRILRGTYHPMPSSYSPDMHALVKQLLQLRPALRPNAAAILQMPFLQDTLVEYVTSVENAGGAVPHVRLQTLTPPSAAPGVQPRGRDSGREEPPPTTRSSRADGRDPGPPRSQGPPVAGAGGAAGAHYWGAQPQAGPPAAQPQAGVAVASAVPRRLEPVQQPAAPASAFTPGPAPVMAAVPAPVMARQQTPSPAPIAQRGAPLSNTVMIHGAADDGELDTLARTGGFVGGGVAGPDVAAWLAAEGGEASPGRAARAGGGGAAAGALGASVLADPAFQVPIVPTESMVVEGGEDAVVVGGGSGSTSPGVSGGSSSMEYTDAMGETKAMDDGDDTMGTGEASHGSYDVASPAVLRAMAEEMERARMGGEVKRTDVFMFNGEHLDLGPGVEGAALTHRLEALRMHLAESLGDDEFFSLYTQLRHVLDDEEDGGIGTATDLMEGLSDVLSSTIRQHLAPEHAGLAPLVEQLVQCERVAYGGSQ